ncbi:MAG: hypothetical protein ACOYLQ_20485 [Hyphomicrobiaceae bacterium]
MTAKWLANEIRLAIRDDRLEKESEQKRLGRDQAARSEQRARWTAQLHVEGRKARAAYGEDLDQYTADRMRVLDIMETTTSDAVVRLALGAWVAADTETLRWLKDHARAEERIRVMDAAEREGDRTDGRTGRSESLNQE